MNSELRDLYQEIILDHNKSPRNFRSMPDGRPGISWITFNGAPNPVIGNQCKASDPAFGNTDQGSFRCLPCYLRGVDC